MKKLTLVLAGLAGIGSSSFGSVVTPTADPMGSTIYQTLFGVEGVPADDSRWYGIDGGQAIYTYWDYEAIEFSTNLSGGDWRVGLTVRENGVLPDWYTYFEVDVYVNDEFLSSVELSAQSNYQTAWFDIGAQSGETDLKLVWTNDAWEPWRYDANLVLGAVQFGQVVPAAPTAGVFALAGLAAMRRRR